MEKKNIEDIRVTGCNIEVVDKNVIRVKGPLGEIKKRYSGGDIEFYKDKILVKSNMNIGTFLSDIRGMLKGVSEGYFMELELVGLGYKFVNYKKSIFMSLGLSHYVRVDEIKSVLILGTRNKLVIYGLSLEEVNRVASGIRQLRRLDSYKGKGIKYLDEVKILKVGKQR